MSARESGSPLIPLSPRVFLRASGPDALRFLNGQLTQDITRVTPSRSLPACALNAKGGLEAVCVVHLVDDDYLLETAPELGEALLARLDRYLIADDVTLAEEAGDWTVGHLLGEDGPEGVAQGGLRSCPRFGRPGFDFLAAGSDQWPDLPRMSADEWEHLRIESGIPLWGHELTTGLLPAEAGLDHYMVSFEKGCYLGQEVISRMKRAGKTNRHLVQLSVPPDTTAPATLHHEGKVCGEITSVSPAGGIALGFRKRNAQEVTTFGIGADSGPAATIR